MLMLLIVLLQVLPRLLMLLIVLLTQEEAHGVVDIVEGTRRRRPVIRIGTQRRKHTRGDNVAVAVSMGLCHRHDSGDSGVHVRKAVRVVGVVQWLSEEVIGSDG